MAIIVPVVLFLTCYVIGSFPTAYVIGRINHVNIFEKGSGNMGATNVTRALGAKWGLLTLGLDGLKGALAVATARLLMPWDQISASVIGAIAVVIGHNWSFLASIITRQIRGGKGVATAIGTAFLMAPPQVILCMLGATAIIVLLTRYVSLGVLVSAAVGAIWMLILIAQKPTNVPDSYGIYAVSVAVMIWVRHWKNIVSLMAGRERRLGERAS